MTAAEFKLAFPEFASAPNALVEGHILQQEVWISNTWSPAEAEIVLGLRVADALARAPFGSNQRLVDPKKLTATTYQIELDRRIRMHAFARGRVG
jgi:hypothetical protein